MTVCIAGICDLGETIVSASDTMLSSGAVASDNVAVKGYSICGRWVVMYAATNVDRVVPILRAVGARLSDRTDYTVDVLKDAFAGDCQAEVAREREERVLRPLGMTLDGFIQKGRASLGPREFRVWMRVFRRIGTECEFLVHGFDPQGRAHIFHVDSSGWIPGEAAVAGFLAIGSGAGPAETSLMYHGYNVGHRLAAAVYRICEAKFTAEAEGGVGPNTVLAITRSDGRYTWLEGEAIDPLRRDVSAGREIRRDLLGDVEAYLDQIRWGRLPTEGIGSPSRPD